MKALVRARKARAKRRGRTRSRSLLKRVVAQAAGFLTLFLSSALTTNHLLNSHKDSRKEVPIPDKRILQIGINNVVQGNGGIAFSSVSAPTNQPAGIQLGEPTKAVKFLETLVEPAGAGGSHVRSHGQQFTSMRSPDGITVVPDWIHRKNTDAEHKATHCISSGQTWDGSKPLPNSPPDVEWAVVRYHLPKHTDAQAYYVAGPWTVMKETGALFKTNVLSSTEINGRVVAGTLYSRLGEKVCPIIFGTENERYTWCGAWYSPQVLEALQLGDSFVSWDLLKQLFLSEPLNHPEQLAKLRTPSAFVAAYEGGGAIH